MTVALNDLSIISAGAGSGKTYTVQKTLTEWLNEHPETIRPDRILAVTFTNMAASEMQSRIRSAFMQNGASLDAAQKVASAQISTIHSFGQKIIQTFAYEAGLSPNFRQLTKAEEKILLQLSLSNHPEVDDLLNKLEALGYKGTYKGDDYVTAIEQLQSRVLDIVDALRTTGFSEDKAQEYISILREELTGLYAAPMKAETLNNTLHHAVKALLKHYPDNLKTIAPKNKTAVKKFTADFKALKQAEGLIQIQTDWALWASLQSLR